MRFLQLAEELQVSNKVLSKKLQNLALLGLIYKDDSKYRLTEEGKAVVELIAELLPPSMDPRVLAEVLKCKWMREIMVTLRGGGMRASELLTALNGLSRKVLTERLRKLEKLQLVRRLHEDWNQPAKYALTEEGFMLSSRIYHYRLIPFNER